MNVVGILNNRGRTADGIAHLQIDAYHHPFHPHPLPAAPTPPSLQWLFTASFKIRPNIAPLAPGPHGIRLDIPILGGTVVGPDGFKGKVLPIGSDWVLVDALSGIGVADARWSIVIRNNLGAEDEGTEVESEIFVRTEGPSLPGPNGLAKAHLQMRFETGSEKWRWMNFVAPLGVLEILNPQNTTQQDVRIDVFNLKDEWSKPLYDASLAAKAAKEEEVEQSSF
ncbi:hypothetical protein JCM6882_001943 [Rhodosporidiobolus microsporus]